MKNFWFDLFLRFVLIPFCVCVEFFSSFSNEIGCTICITTERGDSFVWSQSYCISHCSSILIWSDSMQKSFHTFKIRHILERNSTRKKKCFQIQLCTAIFRLHCGIEREKRGVRYSFIYSVTSGPSEPVGPEGPEGREGPCFFPPDFDRSVDQEG